MTKGILKVRSKNGLNATHAPYDSEGSLRKNLKRSVSSRRTVSFDLPKLIEQNVIERESIANTKQVRLAVGPAECIEWNKIIIPCGNNYKMNEILVALQTASNSPFTPINYYSHGHCAVFYVKYAAPAKDLMALGKKVALGDGKKLTILVKPCAAPQVDFQC